MKDVKLKCPVCGDQFVTKEWVKRKGALKGSKIIKKVLCSSKCRKRMDLLICLNDILEELDRLA